MSRDPRDDYYDNDPDRAERERDFDDDQSERDESVIQRAKGKVMAPAVGLIVVAAFGLISLALALIQYPTLDAQFDENIKQIEDNPGIPNNQKKDQIQMMNQIRDGMKTVWFPYYGLVTVLSVVIFVGAIKLMNLSGSGWPMTAAILSFIPCTSGCCFLGLVFGIWALVVLGQPDVKAGFAARRRAAYSPDRY